MNVKVLSVICGVSVVTLAGYGIYKNQLKRDPLSDIMAANVEALAADESGFITIECIYGGCVVNPWYDCWVYEMGFPKNIVQMLMEDMNKKVW